MKVLCNFRVNKNKKGNIFFQNERSLNDSDDHVNEEKQEEEEEEVIENPDDQKKELTDKST